jgi:organic hydroperoxide reductase OsmC/OhrA
METEHLVFPVSVEWLGDGKLVRAHVDDKEAIDVATPAVFDGGREGVWSPEDFFVAAAASCFAVTLVGIAAKSRVPLHDLVVDGVGIVGVRDDGKFGFREIELGVAVATDEEHVPAARKAIERAERHCLVAVSLDVPVRVDAAVNVTAASAV